MLLLNLMFTMIMAAYSELTDNYTLDYFENLRLASV
jgi:hypothetical protein